MAGQRFRFKKTHSRKTLFCHGSGNLMRQINLFIPIRTLAALMSQLRLVWGSAGRFSRSIAWRHFRVIELDLHVKVWFKAKRRIKFAYRSFVTTFPSQRSFQYSPFVAKLHSTRRLLGSILFRFQNGFTFSLLFRPIWTFYQSCGKETDRFQMRYQCIKYRSGLG